MDEFFNGWRKKVGVFTLLFACMFAAGWVRSFLALDAFLAPLGNHIIFGVSSVDQAIGFKFGYDSEDDEEYFWTTEPIVRWNHSRKSNSEFRLQNPVYPGDGDCPVWYWNFNGLRIGESPHNYYPEIRQSFLLIPYWLVVVPLVLVSLRLLVSKRRRSRPNSRIVRIAETAT